MRVIKGKEVRTFINKLNKRMYILEQKGDVYRAVERILTDVRKHGDRAVKRYTEKFDSLKIKRLAITKREIETSAKKAHKKVVDALEFSARRIKTFHMHQKEKSWYFSEKGVLLGQIIKPLNRVGVYVPGGKASYPSTVLMNIIPAQIAGVKEIAVCVPSHDGRVSPPVAATLKLLSIKEVYRIGGAQAIAAMAFGTESVKNVDKIVGPGNIYVAIAKRMVFGKVDIDMIAGPSEILIIADKTANPVFIAADLLSQAEHDELASSILITDSDTLAQTVRQELQKQLRRLKRSEIAKKSLQTYGAIIITRNINMAISIANEIAPEHLEIMTKTPAELLPRIANAGAVFLGRWTPEPLGDYAAGPNHTLPTCGTARFSSPLGVYDFVKRTSLINFKKEGFLNIADKVQTLADAEGLTGHGDTIRLRIKTLQQNITKGI
jgi:histidinol dehydrogenase